MKTMLAWTGLLLALQGDPKGAEVRGTISPAGPVRVILKKYQTDAAKKENVKGEALLPQAGDFVFENVPPGKYDLLIRPQGEPPKFVGTTWLLVVEPGQRLGKLAYRLTPKGAKAMVDEILVRMKEGTSEQDARGLVESLGGKVMNAMPGGWLVVNVPDDREAEALIADFKAKPGVADAAPHGIAGIK